MTSGGTPAITAPSFSASAQKNEITGCLNMPG
jgi:hypothetical protein